MDVQTTGPEMFNALGKSAALLVSVAAALVLSWRGRAKWEPSEEDVPGALNQLSLLLTVVTMVLILTQLGSQRFAGLLTGLMAMSLIGCLGCFFVYAYLTGTRTFKSGDQRYIAGSTPLPDLKLGPGETIFDYARRVGDPDKVWTAASRARAKILFAVCYLGLNVLGSATLILAALSAPHIKLATIAYPSAGNGVQEQEELSGTARNFDGDEPPWIVVVPWDTQKFCPQAPVAIDAEGGWSLLVSIGLEHDIGRRFTLLLVGVDRAGAGQFRTYLKQTKVSPVYPGIDRLPPETQVFGSATVRRQ